MQGEQMVFQYEAKIEYANSKRHEDKWDGNETRNLLFKILHKTAQFQLRMENMTKSQMQPFIDFIGEG